MNSEPASIISHSLLSPRAREFQSNEQYQYHVSTRPSSLAELSPFAHEFAPNSNDRAISSGEEGNFNYFNQNKENLNNKNVSEMNSPALSATSDDSLNSVGLYKTELCRSFIDLGCCRYGTKCRFAHGWSELRPVSRHRRFKTELCKNYQRDGFCPYGARCRFVHNTETADREEIRSVSQEDWDQIKKTTGKSNFSSSENWKSGDSSPITATQENDQIHQNNNINSNNCFINSNSNNPNWRSPLISSPTDSPWTSHSNSALATPILFDSNLPSPLTPTMKYNEFSIPSSAKSPSFAPFGNNSILQQNRIRAMNLIDSPRTLEIVHDDDDDDLSRWSHSPPGRSLIHRSSSENPEDYNHQEEMPITALRTMIIIPNKFDEIKNNQNHRRPRVSSSASTLLPLVDSLSPNSSTDSASGSFSSVRRHHRASHDLLTDTYEENFDEEFIPSVTTSTTRSNWPPSNNKLQIIDDRDDRYHSPHHDRQQNLHANF